MVSLQNLYHNVENGHEEELREIQIGSLEKSTPTGQQRVQLNAVPPSAGPERTAAEAGHTAATCVRISTL